jgi:hypothetical protein
VGVPLAGLHMAVSCLLIVFPNGGEQRGLPCILFCFVFIVRALINPILRLYLHGIITSKNLTLNTIISLGFGISTYEFGGKHTWCIVIEKQQIYRTKHTEFS